LQRVLSKCKWSKLMCESPVPGVSVTSAASLVQNFLLQYSLLQDSRNLVDVWRRPPDSKPCTQTKAICNHKILVARLAVFPLCHRVYGGSLVICCVYSFLSRQKMQDVLEHFLRCFSRCPVTIAPQHLQLRFWNCTCGTARTPSGNHDVF
jgi:hypothetical protein